MSDFFTAPAVQAGTAMLVLGILITAAFYLVSRYRDYTAEDKEHVEGALSKLQEMHRKGDINDEEFRTIQATSHRQPAESTVNDSSPQGEESPRT
jgi:uncharacterized membrane protein